MLGRTIDVIRRMPFWVAYCCWLILVSSAVFPASIALRWLPGVALAGLGGALILRIDELAQRRGR